MYVQWTLLISMKRPSPLSRSLVGEAAGKAPLGVAKKEDINVNMNQLRGKADSANSVINDTRMVSEGGWALRDDRCLLSRNYWNVVKNSVKWKWPRNRWLNEQKNFLLSHTKWCWNRKKKPNGRGHSTRRNRDRFRTVKIDLNSFSRAFSLSLFHFPYIFDWKKISILFTLQVVCNILFVLSARTCLRYKLNITTVPLT